MGPRGDGSRGPSGSRGSGPGSLRAHDASGLRAYGITGLEAWDAAIPRASDPRGPRARRPKGSRGHRHRGPSASWACGLAILRARVPLRPQVRKARGPRARGPGSRGPRGPWAFGPGSTWARGLGGLRCGGLVMPWAFGPAFGRIGDAVRAGGALGRARRGRRQSRATSPGRSPPVFSAARPKRALTGSGPDAHDAEPGDVLGRGRDVSLSLSGQSAEGSSSPRPTAGRSLSLSLLPSSVTGDRGALLTGDRGASHG